VKTNLTNDPYELEPSAAASRFPAVKWLLALNAAVYLVQLTLIDPERIFAALGLSPGNFPAAWWTVVTYMFVHAGLLHLSLNTATLWMFGSRLEAAWSTRSFVYFYGWCGIGGAIAHLLFARDAALVGASAGVSGVLMAYGFRWPEDRVFLFGFIPTRSRWLVAWMIGINLALGLSGQTLIGWKAHLGGLAFGWLFLNAGSLSGNGVRRWAAAIPDEPEGMPRAVPQPKPVARHKESDWVEDLISKSNPTPFDSSGGASSRHDTERERAARLDHLLDKISTDGLESLTREERTLLDETSRRLRDGGDNRAGDQ